MAPDLTTHLFFRGDVGSPHPPHQKGSDSRNQIENCQQCVVHCTTLTVGRDEMNVPVNNFKIRREQSRERIIIAARDGFLNVRYVSNRNKQTKFLGNYVQFDGAPYSTRSRIDQEKFRIYEGASFWQDLINLVDFIRNANQQPKSLDNFLSTDHPQRQS